MPDALAQVGQFFSGPSGSALTKIAQLGATGAGLFGNISAEKARSDEQNYLKKQQSAATTDPTVLAKQVAAATQPLNQGLVQSVENTVQGSLAEQGLAQSPGIQAAVLSQSLAPFQQQNQQTALALVMKRLGIPIEYANAMFAGSSQPVNLAPLLALLSGGKPPASPSSTSGGTFDMSQFMKMMNPPQETTSSVAPTQLQEPSYLSDANLPEGIFA